MDGCHFFLHVLAVIPLMWGGHWCFGDQSLPWMLSRTSSSLGGCYSPVGDRVCSLVAGVEAPRYNSELLYEAGRTGALPLGEEPLSVPL